MSTNPFANNESQLLVDERVQNLFNTEIPLKTRLVAAQTLGSELSDITREDHSEKVARPVRRQALSQIFEIIGTIQDGLPNAIDEELAKTTTSLPIIKSYYELYREQGFQNNEQLAESSAAELDEIPTVMRLAARAPEPGSKFQEDETTLEQMRKIGLTDMLKDELQAYVDVLSRKYPNAENNPVGQQYINRVRDNLTVAIEFLDPISHKCAEVKQRIETRIQQAHKIRKDNEQDIRDLYGSGKDLPKQFD